MKPRTNNAIAGRIAVALSGAALCAASPAWAAPHAARMLIAQADHGAGGQGGGSTGGGQWKHPESGSTSPEGSSATGPGAAQGQKRDATPATGRPPATGRADDDMQGHHGSDTPPGSEGASSRGGMGRNDGAKGSAANSDKGPGHRGPDTKPGH